MTDGYPETFDNNWQYRVYLFERGSFVFQNKNRIMSEDFPEIMNIDEVCRYLRIPRSSLYKLAQEGKIPGQKVGRHWRFRRKAIDQWLGQMPGEKPLAGERNRSAGFSESEQGE